ncbi:TraX protein [Cohnella sp. SGD-V74]|uniref:TraX family protein n=1 Tax=unclassified Cohnella TaxID=2636738 RepID=UPI000D49070A|nr:MULTISPECIES: TraX family protein [unclassified Cohnella]PRX65091.1 TraX protein [Cohnella sp. SGD-V74]
MLQGLAMMTMLIDHIGLMFFQDQTIFRLIGRIAFPLYACFLVKGYLLTRNRRTYMLRLFVLALISQAPFTLALEKFELNVIFTLLYSLLALWAVDLVSEDLKVLTTVVVLSTSLIIPMDYGIYGVLIIFIFRYVEGRWEMIGFHLLLNGLFFLIYGLGYWVQLFSIFGTILIWMTMSVRPRKTLNKWIYRTFYPAHLLVLWVIQRLQFL